MSLHVTEVVILVNVMRSQSNLWHCGQWWIIVLCLYCVTIICCEGCVDNYSSLREEFLNSIHNVEMLQNTFYPINKAQPVYVMINYYYKAENKSERCPDVSIEFYRDTVARHYNFGHRTSTITNQHLCFWVWTDSVTYLLFPPSFMNTYSLLTESYFSLLSREAMLTLELPKPCNNFTDFVNNIYILTARLKLFASGHPHNFQQHKIRGFSYQLMNEENPSSKLQKVMFTIFSWFAYIFGLGVLLLLSVLQVVVTKKWYKRVYQKAKTSTMFYSLLWSSMFVTYALNVILIGARAVYLIKLNEPKIYIKFMGHTFIMFVTQIAAALAVNVKTKDFPVPSFLHYLFLGCIFPDWSSILIQSLVIWNIYVFIQQIAFHSFFLIIALHTQPIGVASMVMIYTIFLFILVSLVALFMQIVQFMKRVICKQEFKKLPKNIKRLASAVTAGIALMCLMVIWTAFMLISSEFSLDTTRLTHPVIASLLISSSCWLANNMVTTYQIKHASKRRQQQQDCHVETEITTPLIEHEMLTFNASLTVPLIDHESEENEHN